MAASSSPSPAPALRSAAPAGAFEVYLPYGPLAQAIAHDLRRIYALLALGLGVLLIVLYRVVARASRQLRRQAAESRFQALHDPLTGLPNRRSLYERLEEVVARASWSGSAVALLLADLDGFKELNDTLGHHAGDALLAQLRPRLEAALPQAELIARLGGDEFAVLLPPGTGRGAAHEAAGALRAVISGPSVVERISLGLQACVGVVRFPEQGGTPTRC